MASINPDSVGNSTFNVPVTINGPVTFYEPVYNLTANTTVSAAQSSGWFTLNAAAGLTVTLPTPIVGLTYTFVVQTSVTSNSYKIIVSSGASGPQYIQGTDTVSTVAGAADIFQGNGTSHVSFNMNGTTTGGLIGSSVTFTCLSSTSWNVSAQNLGSGTLATSFGTS